LKSGQTSAAGAASSQESHHRAEEDGEFDCRLILFFSTHQDRLKMRRRIFAGRLSGDAGGNRRRHPGKFKQNG